MSEDPMELSDGDRSSLNAEMSTDTISQWSWVLMTWNNDLSLKNIGLRTGPFILFFALSFQPLKGAPLTVLRNSILLLWLVFVCSILNLFFSIYLKYQEQGTLQANIFNRIKMALGEDITAPSVPVEPIPPPLRSRWPTLQLPKAVSYTLP